MSSRLIIRFALLIISVSSLIAPAKPAAAAIAAPKATVATRIYYPEVRLRKMHLVRPDLILYPLFFDVYC